MNRILDYKLDFEVILTGIEPFTDLYTILSVFFKELIKDNKIDTFNIKIKE